MKSTTVFFSVFSICLLAQSPLALAVTNPDGTETISHPRYQSAAGSACFLSSSNENAVCSYFEFSRAIPVEKDAEGHIVSTPALHKSADTPYVITLGEGGRIAEFPESRSTDFCMDEIVCLPETLPPRGRSTEASNFYVNGVQSVTIVEPRLNGFRIGGLAPWATGAREIVNGICHYYGFQEGVTSELASCAGWDVAIITPEAFHGGFMGPATSSDLLGGCQENVVCR